MPTPDLRKLPSVERVLLELEQSGTRVSHAVAVDAARGAIDSARRAALAGEEAPGLEGIVVLARHAIAAGTAASLRPVINATGVILQTNLGRAPLSERAIGAMDAVARGYSNLEYSVEAGDRGSRHDHVRTLIRATTGAEDGLVVNNNAAALLMVLQVFAAGREVIVSRGQAVEIGGGFRIPDVLAQSGARLVEVGTTNRTYTRDYAAAITPETAAILRVHTSNFRVVGFATAAPLSELSALASGHRVLLVDDLGSGCLVDTSAYGIPHEPTVQESIGAGADLALFSGDKLLGGPQCGIVAGKAKLIEMLRGHPLARALRVDKLTIAALTATLQAYREGTERDEIPVWKMLSLDARTLRRRARRWAAIAGTSGAVEASTSMVGGGSLPGEGVPSTVAAIRPPGGAEAFVAALRRHDPPVIGRIHEGAVLLDPRTVPASADRLVAQAIASQLSG